MIDPREGVLLIANPFLKDPNFLRSVVLLCDHNEEGSFGLSLTKRLPAKLDEFMQEIETKDVPVFLGGPVQPETLHYLHSFPNLIPESIEIAPDIFWGGNFESLKIQLANNNFSMDRIKFFIGYSGWSAGQLDDEMKEDAWLTVKATQKIIFETPAEKIWEASLNELGGEYRQMINYPLDPQYN